MSEITPVTASAASSVPNAANAPASSSAGISRTDTLILTPDASFVQADGLPLPNVDLGTFFGDAPSANGADSAATNSAPVATSTPATPRHAAPAPAGAAKDFIDGVGLTEIPPKDKRFDGKSETRQLQREVHSLTQGTARVHAAFEQFRGETTRLLKGTQQYSQPFNLPAHWESDVEGLQSPSVQAAIAANSRDICAATERLELVERSLTGMEATVNVIHQTLVGLVSRVNGLSVATAPAPAAIAAPPPLPIDSTPSPSRLELLLEQLLNKRGRSPDMLDDVRNVRSRVEGSTAAPAPITAPIAAAPITAAAAAPMPAAVTAPVPVAAPITFTPALAPAAMPVPVPIPAAIAVTPAIPAPAAVPVTVAAPAPLAVAAPVPVSVAVAGAPAPPSLPAYDPAKEARLGPVSWGRNITGESAIVIKAVLPAARAVMRNYRARRGPDPNTIIACFESAEIASWFIGAFNAARVSPYESVVASPNV
jgi:hypothetical protein